MEHIQKIEKVLSDVNLHSGTSLSIGRIDGDAPVLRAVIGDMEEFPVFITADEGQILCITYLFDETQIIDGKREELMDVLLTQNMPMPLSAFGKIGEQYSIFGALSATATQADLLEELETLNENTLEALDALGEYLK